MAMSRPVTVGTAPTLLMQAPPGTSAGPSAWFYVQNGSAAIYLGGAAVTSSNSPSIDSAATLTGSLFPGDLVYACSASGTSVTTVLMTGA